MSQKIRDVLEVLAAIRREFRPDVPDSARNARLRAVRSIAAKRGVKYQTIGDAYLRRLEPSIKGTPAFDRVTESWLLGKSDALHRALEKQALDNDDRALIRKFFSAA